MANSSFNLTNFNAEPMALNCPELELGVELSSNISCHLKTLTMNVTNNKGRNNANTRQVSLIIDPREINFIELKSKTGQQLGFIDLTGQVSGFIDLNGIHITLGGTRCSKCEKVVSKPFYKELESSDFLGVFCSDCIKL